MYKLRAALIITLTNLLISSSIFAQSPQKMSYQAVIRNASNNLVASTAIGMQISILQGSSSGTAVYVETQTPTTNANGLVSIEIGGGTVVSGSFATINWANGPYFIKTETDPAGGTSYTITGVSQLLSVPYALHAKTAETISSTQTHYLGEEYLGGIIFYLYTDATGTQKGLVVSKTESTATWSGSTLVGANRTEDGAYNMNLMPTGAGTARTWVEALGAGWYLPSIDELSLLWHNRYNVNKTARAVGSILLSSTAYYWSSTEYKPTTAYYFDFGGGYAYNFNYKTSSYSVRAVRAF